MSSNDANDRKRKPTNIVPETVSINDDENPKESKARKVSTNASASTAAPLQVDTPVATENATPANTASTATEHEESIKSTAAEREESMKDVGKMIQDLFHSDNAKVDAALDALNLDLSGNKNKCEIIVTAGGCLALALLLKKIDSIPVCAKVVELNELAELTTLYKTIAVTTNLTFCHHKGRAGITANGGVEAVVKAMKTFPKCQVLQECACAALGNLAYSNVTGKKQAIESGGIEVLLAALKKKKALGFSQSLRTGMLGSSNFCERQQGKHRSTNAFGR
jgi:hypothetical protein